MSDKSSIPARLPRHIGIIMDGNGRWAQKYGKPRIYGHTKAVRTVREVIRFCAEKQIEVLTLYAFSTENWKRPRSETDYLMDMVLKFLEKEKASLMKNNIRLHWSGRRDRVGKILAEKIESVEKLTASNTGLVLNFAFDYGSRDEIVSACRRIAEDVKTGALSPADITEDTVSRYLYTAGLPDADLIIRTSGEHRISNFLLWQGAYSEYCFFDEYWPDFNKKLLAEALRIYASRERRRGAVTEDHA